MTPIDYVVRKADGKPVASVPEDKLRECCLPLKEVDPAPAPGHAFIAAGHWARHQFEDMDDIELQAFAGMAAAKAGSPPYTDQTASAGEGIALKHLARIELARRGIVAQ